MANAHSSLALNKILKEHLMIPGALCLKNVKQGRDMPLLILGGINSMFCGSQVSPRTALKQIQIFHFFAILIFVLIFFFPHELYFKQI